MVNKSNKIINGYKNDTAEISINVKEYMVGTTILPQILLYEYTYRLR